MHGVKVAVGTGATWCAFSGTQRNHHTSRPSWDFHRYLDLVPVWLIAKLWTVISTDLLQDNFVEMLAVNPDGMNCLGRFTESRYVYPEYRSWIQVR